MLRMDVSCRPHVTVTIIREDTATYRGKVGFSSLNPSHFSIFVQSLKEAVQNNKMQNAPCLHPLQRVRSMC